MARKPSRYKPKKKITLHPEKRRRPHHPYRSMFEEVIDRQLKDLKAGAKYEAEKLHYIIEANYIPDWRLPNWVILEAKGHFTAADRKKMLRVQEAHPERIICIIFQRASNTLSKYSKTTYGDWATANNFRWSDGKINPEWLKIPNQKKIARGIEE